MLTAPFTLFALYAVFVPGTVYMLTRSTLMAPLRGLIGYFLLPASKLHWMYCMYCVAFWVGALAWFGVESHLGTSNVFRAIFLGGPISTGIMTFVQTPPTQGVIEEAKLIAEKKVTSGRHK